nr:2Fe-2S iron-sulfur cluster-binding protein [Marichromatium bheemlicum]
MTLSRAARLAGVSRGELQRRIRHGELMTFEGEVAVHDLLRLYPSVSLEHEGALEQVREIADNARPRLEPEPVALPDARVLLEQARRLSAALAREIEAGEAARGLMEQVANRIAALSTSDPATLPTALAALGHWLAEARAALPLNETPEERSAPARTLAARVRLIPSGHSFLVEGEESLLEAAVRAGIHLEHGCASGNCGGCKARLVSGETRQIRAHDYPIGARERRLGYLLTCAHTALTDLTLEVGEARSGAELPLQRIRANVRRIERLGPTLLMLQIQTPRNQVLRFVAGQRARLGRPDEPLSELPIASCPCDGRNLRFLVRAGDDPLACALFAGRLAPGQRLELEGPHGDFGLTTTATETAIFIACGDGIAPIRSLIEQAIAIDEIDRYRLYWETGTPEGHYLAHWARALGDALDDFTYTLLGATPATRLGAQILHAHRPREDQHYYLAGPRHQITALRQALIAGGLSPAQLTAEPLPAVETPPPSGGDLGRGASPRRG